LGKHVELNVYTRSSNIYGGHVLYGLVGRWIELGLTSYGTAVNAIDLTACFHGGEVGHPSLQPSYDKYHAEYLPSLPKAKFYRKKATFELQYETMVTDATFLRLYGKIDLTLFMDALAEVAERLRVLDTKLKKSDDFDLRRFHIDVAKAVSRAPNSEVELRDLKTRTDEERNARLAALGPWERLAIEWDEFHPDARRLLDDPLLWELSNDYAPNGSDTGADLLADFKTWNKRHPKHPAYQMAAALLVNWDIGPIDLRTTEAAEVERLREADSISLQVTNDAMIAVPFAAIKHRGWCDLETIELGLAAIARQRVAAACAKQEGHDTTEWELSLKKLERFMNAFPTCAPSDRTS
jgi:uncharacterized protein YfeS